jgi:tetratricopeptide (TPR) repeat protein
MDVGTAIVLGIWGALAATVILRLRRRGGAAFDDRFSPADRRLVGAAAFYLAVPPLVLLSQLLQVAVMRALGTDLGLFETYVYWGVLEPADPGRLAPLGRAVVAAVGPLSLLTTAGALLAWTRFLPGNAARNHLRLELARVLLILSLGVHPILSLLVQRGDLWMARVALNELHPSSGDVALLGYGILAAYAFWRWRRAHRLRLLASAVHDATRRASGKLGESPDDPEALRALGAAQLAAGDEAAVETLGRALERSPDDPRVELLLGRAHLEHGDAQGASEHLRHAGRLLEEQSDPARQSLLFEVTLALSAARIALGDAEGAILTAEAARDHAPGDPRGLLMHADALMAGGRLDEAEQRLERALESAHGVLRAEIERRLAALRS